MLTLSGQKLLSAGLSPETLAEKVASLKWFHRIEISGGIKTPGIDLTEQKLEALGLPEDMTGMDVLVLGAYDGFFAFECESRGADHVLAVDRYTAEAKDYYQTFNFMRTLLDSKVKPQAFRFENVSPAKHGMFDLVLCVDILAHIRDPFMVLERISKVARAMSIFECLVDCIEVPGAVGRYYLPGEVGDPTTYWAPNQKAAEYLLKATGFGTISFRGVWCPGVVPDSQTANGRAVFHCRKEEGV